MQKSPMFAPHVLPTMSTRLMRIKSTTSSRVPNVVLSPLVIAAAERNPPVRPLPKKSGRFPYEVFAPGRIDKPVRSAGLRPSEERAKLEFLASKNIRLMVSPNTRAALPKAAPRPGEIVGNSILEDMERLKSECAQILRNEYSAASKDKNREEDEGLGFLPEINVPKPQPQTTQKAVRLARITSAGLHAKLEELRGFRLHQRALQSSTRAPPEEAEGSRGLNSRELGCHEFLPSADQLAGLINNIVIPPSRVTINMNNEFYFNNPVHSPPSHNVGNRPRGHKADINICPPQQDLPSPDSPDLNQTGHFGDSGTESKRRYEPVSAPPCRDLAQRAMRERLAMAQVKQTEGAAAVPACCVRLGTKKTSVQHTRMGPGKYRRNAVRRRGEENAAPQIKLKPKLQARPHVSAPVALNVTFGSHLLPGGKPKSGNVKVPPCRISHN